MEIYVQLILLLALIKYCLQAALTGRLWMVVCYGAVAALVGLLLYPLVIEQPVTLASWLLANHRLVMDGAVLTTIEAVGGIFISIYLLVNYFRPRRSRRKSIFALKVMPGLLFFVAIAYFELLFFKWRVGGYFLTTALIYATVVFVSVVVFSMILGHLLEGESSKLELKILLNIAILTIGLLITSSVVDYSVSHAQTTIEWRALLAITGLGAALFVAGLYLSRINLKSLFKRN